MPKGSSNIYDYMNSLSVSATAETVDALTVTAVGLEGKLSISLIIDAMRDKLLLEEKKPFKFRQAVGWQRGSVSYAEEMKQGVKLWCILMVRGELSEIAFTEAQKLEDIKVTRLDIAVDIQMLERVSKLPRKLKDTYKGKYETILYESLTGDTLNVGSRESGIFIRIYDKSDEYDMDLGYVWRFEVEFKNERAVVVANILKTQGLSVAQDVVWTALRSRDIPSPKIGQTVNLKARKVTYSTSEMKLAWLGRQVRPTVDFLRSIGKEQEVYRQLGFDWDDKFDK